MNVPRAKTRCKERENSDERRRRDTHARPGTVPSEPLTNKSRGVMPKTTPAYRVNSNADSKAVIKTLYVCRSIHFARISSAGRYSHNKNILLMMLPACDAQPRPRHVTEIRVCILLMQHSRTPYVKRTPPPDLKPKARAHKMKGASRDVPQTTQHT